MVKGILLLLVAVYCNLAEACTCGYLSLDTTAVRSAQQVFVFRLISARIDEGASIGMAHSKIIGRIEIIAEIRGSSDHVSELSFSTQRCCGTRLDVGGYFVAFLPQTGISFEANNGNVVEIGPAFDLPYTQAKINAVLAGKRRFEDVFSREDTDRTEQEPVVAPPCPLPSRAGLPSSRNGNPTGRHAERELPEPGSVGPI
jgi:hypothetical protein